MPAGFDIEKGVDLVFADADAGAESWQIEIVEAPGGALERHVHGLVLSQVDVCRRQLDVCRRPVDVCRRPVDVCRRLCEMAPG
ncbi:hypothetical protein [Mesorhizobium sp.]|uniref:hypothetical protein n=1 Tax=Mesorhizobium sp. TaxID=1871066 RepID=UPI0025849E99|nr:hypothetical protein [Mesorhizobium sp.]